MTRYAWLLLFVAAPALASTEPPYTFKPDTGNISSLQRGARNYMSYCAGCHSLKYLRYNRLGRDLNIPEELLKKHLMFTSEKVGDVITTAMPGPSGDPSAPSQSETWFGRAPPDLTLTARERGPSWVYSYLLTFYLDPTKPTGVNNIVLPGASMPHVLGDLQGWQAKIEQEGEHGGPKFELVQPGSMSPNDYKEFVADTTNFLIYAAEPGRNQRMALGGPILLFIAVFWALTYLLKLEYWKDVH